MRSSGSPYCGPLSLWSVVPVPWCARRRPPERASPQECDPEPVSTAQLIPVDQILSVLVVAVWGTAAGFCLAVTRQPGVRRIALITTALVAAAIVATGARVATAIALAGAG